MGAIAPCTMMNLRRGKKFLCSKPSSDGYPFSHFAVEAGILSSNPLNAPFLISPSQPTIGASQNFHYKFSDNTSLYFQLRQSIPSEQEKFYRVGQIDKEIPSLLMETMELRYKNLSLLFGLFSFNQLSHTTAHQSQFMGNSVLQGTKETASFLYHHQGYFFQRLPWHPPLSRFRPQNEGTLSPQQPRPGQ